MVNVTKECFYKYILPRDIVTHELTREKHIFELRGGPVIGETEGYAADDQKFYRLTEDALKEIKYE